jgi:serine/threonine protein kinase
MSEPAQKRVKTVDLNAINWDDVEFIMSLGSGSYGCTFEASYQGERYAVKVEKLTQATLENKEVEINRIISQDSQNPFKLHLYDSIRYEGVLKKEIRDKMHEKCHKLWDKWWDDGFKGTWQITMMELAAENDIKVIKRYCAENIEKTLFSLLYAVSRMHSLGIVHHDIRFANLVLKYTSEPVILDIRGQKFKIADPGEQILAVIDYGISTLNEYRSEYYEGFAHWYGPSPVKRLLDASKHGGNTDYITQTSAVDIWMIGLLVLSLNTDFVINYINADLPKKWNMRGTKLAEVYGNVDLVYLAHMGFVSKLVDAPGMDPLVIEYVLSRTNPYEFLGDILKQLPDITLALKALFSWDEGLKLHYLHTGAYFTLPMFKKLRFDARINSPICDFCGVGKAKLKCIDCNNAVFCSEQCHKPRKKK